MASTSHNPIFFFNSQLDQSPALRANAAILKFINRKALLFLKESKKEGPKNLFQPSDRRMVHRQRRLQCVRGPQLRSTLASTQSDPDKAADSKVRSAI